MGIPRLLLAYFSNVEWGVRTSATLNVIVPAPTDRAPLGTGPQNFEQSLLEVQSVVDVKIGFFEEFFHVGFLSLRNS